MTTAAHITGAVRHALGLGGPLSGKTVIVTAGGTHEELDPVRYIGNRSSGRMGYAIAQSVLDAGGNAILITGPSFLPAPIGACAVHVESATEMNDAVHGHIASAQAIVMTAAVADFRPAQISAEKIKKQDGQEGMILDLARNPDIIGGLRDAPLVRIGFAAETNDHAVHGKAKLAKKNLDLVVVNDAVDTIGAANSAATIIVRDKEPEVLPRMIKERLAALIVERLPAMISAR